MYGKGYKGSDFFYVFLCGIIFYRLVFLFNLWDFFVDNGYSLIMQLVLILSNECNVITNFFPLILVILVALTFLCFKMRIDYQILDRIFYPLEFKLAFSFLLQIIKYVSFTFTLFAIKCAKNSFFLQNS